MLVLIAFLEFLILGMISIRNANLPTVELKIMKMFMKYSTVTALRYVIVNVCRKLHLRVIKFIDLWHNIIFPSSIYVLFLVLSPLTDFFTCILQSQGNDRGAIHRTNPDLLKVFNEIKN